MSKGKVLSAIRRQCIECMGGHPPYVQGCTSPACSLFPYRAGSDPEAGKNITPEQRAIRANRMRNIRKTPITRGKPQDCSVRLIGPNTEVVS